ncbi:MAG: hypothetical protein ACK56I_00075 [bacterium]
MALGCTTTTPFSPGTAVTGLGACFGNGPAGADCLTRGKWQGLMLQ